MLDKATTDSLEPLTFLDLDWKVVEREIARNRAERDRPPRTCSATWVAPAP
jgi:hypothetical protein